ncbi:ribonuclease T [Roseinatronobacter sp.]|uniref:ribonuclease T2 family protein n=1 Tax=Roseinatronobacter sp. TaxID=1945755 RepID=UPI0025EC9D26|nr:ribonuclease T [Rhodobaca sp.]
MRKFTLAALAILALFGWVLLEMGEDRPRSDGYLVLALSWTPSWCAVEGAARGDARCEAGSGAGWLVHGLWPQHDGGTWPEFCETEYPSPSRAALQGMMDIMGSVGLARHQWAKHGSCSGRDAQAYFAQTRAAFTGLDFPQSLHADAQPNQITPDRLLAEFRAANPRIGPDMVALTCRAGMAQELRLCLTHDLEPRRCDDGLLARGCSARMVTLPSRP